MKKVCFVVMLSLFAITRSHAATFEWSFLVSNSQSDVSPVNVTAYLYASDYGIWVWNNSFNPSTLILTDSMLGIEYSPVGYPVTTLTTQVSPLTEDTSKIIISWQTDPRLDTPTDCPMNLYSWCFILVDEATPDYFTYGSVRFYYSFWPGHWDEKWDDTHRSPLDLGEFYSVPEPSAVLLALSGFSLLLLRRRMTQGEKP